MRRDPSTQGYFIFVINHFVAVRYILSVKSPVNFHLMFKNNEILKPSTVGEDIWSTI